MNKNEIIQLFDEEEYREVFNVTNPYKKEKILASEILYFLKSKIVLDGFQIKDKKEIKKIFFYYFYLVWEVKFENNYIFYFKKELLNLDINNLNERIIWLNNFKQYFNIWKNEVFLNKIIDRTVLKEGLNYGEWALKVDNIIDFFINFTYECSELYVFSWVHFPLFKWLINELVNEK